MFNLFRSIYLRIQIYQLFWMPRIADHLSGVGRFLADAIFARDIVGFCPTAGALLMIANKANEAEANHKNDTYFAYAHGRSPSVSAAP